MHFYFGKGAPKTLAEIGYLRQVIAKTHEVVYPNLKEQLISEARKTKDGEIIYDTIRGYPKISEVKFELGGGTIITQTKGVVTTRDGRIYLEATVNYKYTDTFTDPANFREKLYHSSAVHDSNPIVMTFTDLLGSHYDISDEWKSTVSINVSE